MVLSNYPALKRDEVALAVIETVIPALAVAIDEAAQDVAANLFGDEATTFDIERIANDVLFALGDYLDLSPVPRRGVHDLLRVHQLNNVAYAEDYFHVKADEETPCEFTLTETEQALADSVLSTVVDTPAKSAKFADLGTMVPKSQQPYVPASVSPPTEPRVVVDNRAVRTLDDIKREVSGITKRPVTPVHFLRIDQHQEDTRIERERAQLAKMRESEAKERQQLAERERRAEAKAEGLDICENVTCQAPYKRNHATQKYCCRKCRQQAYERRERDERARKLATVKGRERLF